MDISRKSRSRADFKTPLLNSKLGIKSGTSRGATRVPRLNWNSGTRVQSGSRRGVMVLRVGSPSKASRCTALVRVEPDLLAEF